MLQIRNRRYVIRGCYLLIVFLWVLFIYSNSLRPGDASNEQSALVTDSLNDLLALFRGSCSLSGTLVRMLAHVGEFFVLGALLFLSAPIFGKKSFFYLTCTSLIGILVGFSDETIQYFVPGRSMSVSDMILDAIGALLGYWGLLLLFRIIKGKKKKQ